MTRRVPNRSRRSWACSALFLLFLFPLALLSRLAAADSFPGYPAAVRNQAVRVVEAAGPGKEEALEREAASLRRAMFYYAILSMNAVPDRIFDRAVREGWKTPVGRIAARGDARGAALRSPLDGGLPGRTRRISGSRSSSSTSTDCRERFASTVPGFSDTPWDSFCSPPPRRAGSPSGRRSISSCGRAPR